MTGNQQAGCSAESAGAVRSRIRPEGFFREEGSELMKTMTCKQLGGPCDHQHQGQDADEVI